MPMSYVVCEDGKLVLERWTGNVSHQEVVEHVRRQLQDVSIAPGAAILANCTEASFDTPADRVFEISAPHGQTNNKTRISKYALLMNDETWERGQILSKQAEKYGITIIVFCSLDAACTWLGIEERKAAALIESIDT